MAQGNELRRREFTYRGKTLEELKKMNVREFAEFLPSRSRRSVLRQFQVIENFVNRAKTKFSGKKTVRTHQRDLVVVPDLVGMKLQIYNGKTFVPVIITEEMLGCKLGEFSGTRGRIKHGSAGVGATKGTKFKSKK